MNQEGVYARAAKEAEDRLLEALRDEKGDEPGGPDLHENEAAVWSVHGPVCVLPMVQRNRLRAIRAAARPVVVVEERVRVLNPRPAVDRRAA